MIKTKDIRINKKYWLQIGVSNRFAIGLSIDKYYINLDLICFFITLEL